VPALPIYAAFSSQPQGAPPKQSSTQVFTARLQAASSIVDPVAQLQQLCSLLQDSHQSDLPLSMIQHLFARVSAARASLGGEFKSPSLHDIQVLLAALLRGQQWREILLLQHQLQQIHELSSGSEAWIPVLDASIRAAAMLDDANAMQSLLSRLFDAQKRSSTSIQLASETMASIAAALTRLSDREIESILQAVCRLNQRLPSTLYSTIMNLVFSIQNVPLLRCVHQSFDIDSDTSLSLLLNVSRSGNLDGACALASLILEARSTSDQCGSAVLMVLTAFTSHGTSQHAPLLTQFWPRVEAAKFPAAMLPVVLDASFSAVAQIGVRDLALRVLRLQSRLNGMKNRSDAQPIGPSKHSLDLLLVPVLQISPSSDSADVDFVNTLLAQLRSLKAGTPIDHWCSDNLIAHLRRLKLL
jgi:hypothetical protein